MHEEPRLQRSELIVLSSRRRTAYPSTSVERNGRSARLFSIGDPAWILSKVGIGHNPPYDINVVIEVPLGGVPVKYELDKESGALFVDRFLHTAMFYPGNYGFVPHTLADDGDPGGRGRDRPDPGGARRGRPLPPGGALMMEGRGGRRRQDHRRAGG